MKLISKILILSLCGIFAGCNKPAKNEDQDSVVTEIPELDTAASIVDTVATVPVDTLAADKSTEGEYPDGILPVIREEAPEYYEKLKRQGNEGFIIVDKARMKVLLYDGDGYAKRVYGMACAKNYGTKRQKADSRTPEGYFNVQGVYDSTDWLYTDDNGKTSKKKGQYGPRFIRIAPQIGIHGTCAPWSIGHRALHGCIRITNENIMELHQLVHVGMPVIVLPGKKDRAVNREEGNDVIYFATQTKYEITAQEEQEAEKKAMERAERELAEQKAREDSLARALEQKALEISDSVKIIESEESEGEQSSSAEKENENTQYF